MNRFTVDRLKAVLAEDSEKKERAREAAEKESLSTQDEAAIPNEAIHEFYRKHGILGGPVKGILKRCIPDSVYRCPLSEPMTTLVQWDSLPQKIQDRYKKPESGGIVEVLRRDLLAEEMLEIDSSDADGSKNNPSLPSLTHGLQRRPLGGNLTNKLTEYTRGRSGQAKPFVPGGLDANEIAAKTGSASTNGILPSKNENDYLNAEAIERSLSVLKHGSKVSWNDGTLITSPPGVDFKVGLSYENVYGERDNEHADDHFTHNNADSFQAGESQDTSKTSIQRVSTNVQAVQWDQSFLDDDSLFGSSDSGSESQSETDSSSGSESSSNIEDEDNEDTNDSTSDTDGKIHGDKKVDEILIDVSRDDDFEGSDQEIDQLLRDLVKAEKSTKKEMIKKDTTAIGDDGTANNPLRLAESQFKLQSDNNRKSWASTALLPIEDFHSYIPNPAQRYSFTLDTFQQQAVARLERNESVFVAAHTSAGTGVAQKYLVIVLVSSS